MKYTFLSGSTVNWNIFWASKGSPEQDGSYLTEILAYNDISGNRDINRLRGQAFCICAHVISLSWFSCYRTVKMTWSKTGLSSFGLILFVNDTQRYHSCFCWITNGHHVLKQICVHKGVGVLTGITIQNLASKAHCIFFSNDRRGSAQSSLILRAIMRSRKKLGRYWEARSESRYSVAPFYSRRHLRVSDIYKRERDR